jgi:hypothetical protein
MNDIMRQTDCAVRGWIGALRRYMGILWSREDGGN